MGDEHDKIVKILKELCDGYGYARVYAHNISENYQPLLITLSRRGRSLAENYYPDIWAEKKRGSVEVFEVWHAENEQEAILDILFSTLVKNIRFMSIVCTGYGITEDRAKDLVDLILGNLYSGGYQKFHPDNVFIASIPEEIKGDYKAIKKHLKKALRF